MARTPIPRFETAAAFRRSWHAGFTLAICQRLAESEKLAERQAESRAAATQSALSQGSRVGGTPRRQLGR